MVGGWQEAARALWGDDWIAPAADVLAINRRTLERWKAGQGEPRPALARDLISLARGLPEDRRIFGHILRRIALGETPSGIADEIAGMERALRQIKARDGLLASLRGKNKPRECGGSD